MSPRTILFPLFVAGVSSAALAGPFNQNLLLNPGAEAGLTGWQVTGDVIASGDWQAPVSGSFVFNTSYEWGALSQTVDFISAGFSAAELDAGVNITFSQWVGARFDAGVEYFIRVTLFDAFGAELAQQGVGSVLPPPDFSGGDDGDLGFDGENFIPGDAPILALEYAGESLPAGSGWILKLYQFTDIVGARSALVEVAGKDSNFWGGYYGAAFDDASLTVSATVIPEPASFAALLGLGALGVAALRRRPGHRAD